MNALDLSAQLGFTQTSIESNLVVPLDETDAQRGRNEVLRRALHPL